MSIMGDPVMASVKLDAQWHSRLEPLAPSDRRAMLAHLCKVAGIHQSELCFMLGPCAPSVDNILTRLQKDFG